MGTLEDGARNALHTCLRVAPGERVVLITDRHVPDVGDALEHAARALTPHVTRHVLEDHGPRPLTTLPDSILRDAARADVSLWAAASVPGELPTRMAYRKHLTRARHAHMPGITRTLMETGMNADYHQVAELTLRLHQRLQGAHHARVTSPHGTDFEAIFHPQWRWLPDTGLLHATPSWGNLPAGEIYTAPAWLHGHLATHLLGDHLSERHGRLHPPLHLDVRDNHVDLDSITGATPAARQDLRTYLTSDPQGTRASEFALGTNLALTHLVGNLLQDEKIPGCHIAFGHPYTEQTGAPWTANTHIDLVLLDTTVWIDGKLVQEHGRYVL